MFDNPFLKDTASTASDRISGNLNLDEFQKMIDKLYPVLYYAIDKNIEPGSFYHVDEGEFNPEFILCHPDDFEAVKDRIKTRRLVHINDEPKEAGRDRILKSLKKRYPPPSYF